jgi:hypothetical protein
MARKRRAKEVEEGKSERVERAEEKRHLPPLPI